MTKKEKKKYQWTWYCKECDQYFRTSIDLKTHRSTHLHKCLYCGQIFETGQKLNNHQRFCILNPKAEQNKQKQIRGLKNYFKNLTNDSRWKNGDHYISVPCQQLKQFLTDNNIHFYPEYFNPDEFEGHNYRIDIAFLNQKIAIEVNGNQHYNKDGTLTQYFQQRHEVLQRAGWRVYQIPYLETYSIDVRQKLLKLIKQNVDFDYDYSQQIKQAFNLKKLKYICPICGKKKSQTSKCCDQCKKTASYKELTQIIGQKLKENINVELPTRKCLNCGEEYVISKRLSNLNSKCCSTECRIQYNQRNIPSKQQLIKDKEQLKSYSAIGRKYGKSDNAVRRWFHVIYKID